MDSEHFCECESFAGEGWWWWSTVRERHGIRPLNSVTCLLGVQWYKSLGEVGKTCLSTNVFEIA